VSYEANTYNSTNTKYPTATVSHTFFLLPKGQMEPGESVKLILVQLLSSSTSTRTTRLSSVKQSYYLRAQGLSWPAHKFSTDTLRSTLTDTINTHRHRVLVSCEISPLPRLFPAITAWIETTTTTTSLLSHKRFFGAPAARVGNHCAPHSITKYVQVFTEFG
jgi:hypothetical protein